MKKYIKDKIYPINSDGEIDGRYFLEVGFYIFDSRHQIETYVYHRVGLPSAFFPEGVSYNMMIDWDEEIVNRSLRSWLR